MTHRTLPEPAPHNRQNRTQATGGQAARAKGGLSAEWLYGMTSAWARTNSPFT